MRSIDDGLEIIASERTRRLHGRHIDYAIDVRNALGTKVSNLVSILDFERTDLEDKSGGYSIDKKMLSINFEFSKNQIRELHTAKERLDSKVSKFSDFPAIMRKRLDCYIPTVDEKIIQTIQHEYVHPYDYSCLDTARRDYGKMIEGIGTNHSTGELALVSEYTKLYITDPKKIRADPTRKKFYKETLAETLSNLGIGKGVGVNPTGLELGEKRYYEWIAKYGLPDFVKLLQGIDYQLED